MNIISDLIKQGAIEKDKVASLEYDAKTSNKKIEELILEKKLVSEELLFKVKSKKLKIPLKKVFAEDIPADLLKFIPEQTSEHYRFIVLDKKDNVLNIGMVYPEDIKAQQTLKFLSRQGKFSYNVSLITFSDFKEIFKKYRSIRSEVSQALEKLEIEMKEEKIIRSEMKSAEWQKLAEEAPISKIVAVLLRHAVEGEASDIHIEPMSNRLRVRFRVLGELYSSILLPISYLSALVARIKILSGMRIDEIRIPQDGRFSAKIGDGRIDFRVSTFPTSQGEKVAIRVLDPKTSLKRLSDLGFGEKNFKLVEQTIKNQSGMLLVTGPTGSGKTTTLYSILQLVNRNKMNIVTLEDPVEYFMEGINQSQINSEIGYTFASGLRYVLRQDPDVIMIGEMRDTESTKLAVHAALTGHLVISTLHTSNVFSIIPRLIDLEIEPYLLPVVLNLLISQRLVRKLCSHCKKKVEAKGKTREVILKEVKNMPSFVQEKFKISDDKPFYIWESVGCKHCRKLGFSDRIGVFEVLKMTDELAKIILKGITESLIMKEAAKQEMLTMRQDAIFKVLQGDTTIEEALRIEKTSAND